MFWAACSASPSKAPSLYRARQSLLYSRDRFVNSRIFNTRVRSNECDSTLRSGGNMTYCQGISTNEGLVIGSDSRTNADFDQLNTCRKMSQFVQPGVCVFGILTSGSLSIRQ